MKLYRFDAAVGVPITRFESRNVVIARGVRTTDATHAAVICGDEVNTYGELEARSNRLAHLFRQWGLRPGEGIALLMGNEARFYEFYWAAMRAGLYFTPVNTHLTPAEMQYIVADCDAK